MENRITTKSVEAERRLDFWQSVVSDLYAPVAIKDCHQSHFDAQITSTPLDKLTISRFSGVRQTIARPNSLIKSGDCDDYVAVVQLGGLNQNQVNGRESRSLRNSITLYDLSRTYELQATERLSIIDVSIPRTEFERVFGRASSAVGLSIGADQASGPTICGFFRSLMDRGHLLDPTTAARMAAIGIDMLAAGFAEKLAQEPRVGVSAETILYRAKAVIEHRLGDVTLNVGLIAAILNLSVRRLHEVFAQQEMSVDAYLWERRLIKASLLLRDSAYDALPIANIGYCVGFGSAAHFARRFRQHFGTTPTSYRNQSRHVADVTASALD